MNGLRAGELTPTILPEAAIRFGNRPDTPVRETARVREPAVSTTVTVALAVGALVVLVAAVALRVADRLGLPSLLLYLGLGVALGESGVGVRFSDVALTQTLGVAALVLILAEGGLTTRLVRRAPRRRPGPGAVHGRGRGQRRGHRRGHRRAAGHWTGAGRCCSARS